MMKTIKPIVAVVENDSSLLKAVERLLTAYGYASETFASAESFLERKSEDELGCLVLDINLDGISGIELQKKLKESGSSTPVIFITGLGDEATIAQAVDLGCIAFLHKPFESRSLQSALNKVLTIQVEGESQWSI